MSALEEVDAIILGVERILKDASDKVLTNPTHTRSQISAAIDQIHAVRGFLL